MNFTEDEMDKAETELTKKDAPINMCTCRSCGQMKERIPYNGKYYDLNKRRWNGRMCPQCNVEFTRSNMKKLRTEKIKPFKDEWSNYES